jgi:3-oxoadipate enol-lactonase
METARVNGIDVCYDVAGGGPWIVLSHSLACDRTMWDEQTAMLTRRFRVLRYDTRGHGHSSAPPGPYTLDLLADDLKALLAHLGIDRTHFAGLSMGGMIGQTFEIKYPGIFQTLVLCDTTSAYPASAAPIWNERIRTARTEGMAALVDSTLARWFTQPFRDRRADVMQRFAALISSTPVEGYVGCSQALVRINVTEQLRNVRVPALVIVGEHDPGTPVAMARAIHEHLSGSKLAVLPDAAHIANVEQPEAFNRALEAFLATNTPKSPPR